MKGIVISLALIATVLALAIAYFGPQHDLLPAEQSPSLYVVTNCSTAGQKMIEDAFREQQLHNWSVRTATKDRWVVGVDKATWAVARLIAGRLREAHPRDFFAESITPNKPFYN